ncbi:hypothetical protein QWZ13_06460 [Reinekea marina]|uniref:Uncharacterized protein n=1 Tax=Reinekea marina TaxID=1310421 RepID=A0ABV7WQR4_9GAMM|nr:hypothetical protein [Reinekea marina]MBU2864865.1 hypothetical protein [Reinekea forsetii]MDN3648551.1 hypothetical protein [Reinekea marina]
MVKWWSLDKQHPKGVFIEQGELHWYRHNGVLTRLVIDELRNVSVFSYQDQVFWHLIDQHNNIAVIPEQTMGMPIIRQYLSSWRGFNYDALLRYEPEQQAVQLWPIEAKQKRA